MRLIGHGIDAIDVERIARSLREHGDRFLERVFTPRERQYAQASKRRDEHLAARFAAKEAAFKALGTGWGDGVSWTDVEVVSLDSGKPTLQVHSRAAEVARNLGIESWTISLTHTSTLAIASVIAAGP